MHIKIPPSWEIPENQVTPQHYYLNRRQMLKGTLGLGMMGLVGSYAQETPQEKKPAFPGDELYPAKHNDLYTVDRDLTNETVAGTYNNFYEISTQKEKVHLLGKKFKTDPWTLKIHGEVNNPLTLDLDQLMHLFPLEERN
ncbi:MAG: protein-methionine-sulfoxide reductase catalytic subunit MsrP, partial [Planctomycetota bacterium]